MVLAPRDDILIPYLTIGLKTLSAFRNNVYGSRSFKNHQ